ncbi:MAG: DNA repair protein RecN [Firmicutes bacterium]|nr:DNA repair protein RecN [Bacillota bacterium]
MLRGLHVKEFALVEDLSLEFAPGFNVLSGETGAGKSIIVGAIGLVLGGRADTGQVRAGAGTARVEAIFEPAGEPTLAELGSLLKKAGIEEPGEGDPLIISREVHADGRSSIGRVNGRAVPISFLRELGDLLVDLHGQHQHQSLLRPDRHLELLDAFDAGTIHPLRGEISALLSKKKEWERELAALGQDTRERERRLDLLRFQIREIEEARLKPQEERELKEKENVLTHAERIAGAISSAYRLLSGGDFQQLSVRDQLGQVLSQINSVSRWDPSLKGIEELLEGAAAHLEEASLEIGTYRSGTTFDPRELERVQSRLDVIRGLKRKYGETVEDVLNFSEQCSRECERLQKSEEHALQLEEKIDTAGRKLASLCRRLTQRRREAAASLQKHLQQVFPDLALEKAVLEVRIGPTETGPRGADQVEFLFSANPGERPKPLVNIISGGEVARVMLALKTVFARQDPLPTLIFDEADAGIGGATVLAVAEKMADLSRYHQILTVTHSPQVASMADNHYFLFKEVEGGRTMTRARKLQPEERAREIARMLDGGIGRVNLEHAALLIERAEKYKRVFK